MRSPPLRNCFFTEIVHYTLLKVQKRTRILSIIQRCVIASRRRSNLLHSCAEIEILRRFASEYSRATSICHAERSEASRSLIRRVLLALNEILRHFVPQNDAGQKAVISSESRSGDREIPGMILAGSPERRGNEPAPRSALIGFGDAEKHPCVRPGTERSHA